jgi:restriction endonuclease Mrr
MVNKRVSPSEDPLVHVDFLITKSQKRYLDDLGSSKRSAFIRKLIDAQINTNPYAAEEEKLKERIEQRDREQNIDKAQLIEFQAEKTKKQITSNTREELVADALIRLKGSIRERNFESILKVNLEMINKKLGGNGEPVTSAELKKLLGLKVVCP